MVDQAVGKVVGIAVRTSVKGPMKEIREAVEAEGGGIEGDVPSKPDRGVTLISAQQWKEVTLLLGADLPRHTRRATVLVYAPTLDNLVGKTIKIGLVVVQVTAESKPCELMDRLHPSLRDALTPECRGGVYGRVLKAGEFRVDDAITFL